MPHDTQTPAARVIDAFDNFILAGRDLGEVAYTAGLLLDALHSYLLSLGVELSAAGENSQEGKQ